MAHRRPQSLNPAEAKGALLDWGRATDRAVGRFVAANRWRILGGAVATGVAAGILGGRRGRRARHERAARRACRR